MLKDRSPHPWITFTALSLIFFLVSAGTFSSMGGVLRPMVQDLHWNWAQAGLGYTFLGLSCGLASLMPAMLIRRIGVHGSLFCGSVLLVIGFGLLAATHVVWTYLLATLLIGTAFSLVGTVPGTHVLTDLFKRRSTALGAYFTIGALGGVAGPLLYVVVDSTTHGWRAYWIVFAVASVVLGGFAIFATPKRYGPISADSLPPEQVAPAALIEGLHDWTVQRALGTIQFYVIVGAYSMYLLINTTAHGFAVEHLTENGIDAKVAAGMLSLEALIGAGVSVAGGIIGEKVSPKTLLIVALASLCIGMAGLAEAHGYILMLVYAIGMGIGFGLTFIASTVLLFNYFGKKANLELYSIMCLISTSAALGPAFGGWARDTLGSFTGLFLLCAALTVIMLVATCFITPPVFDAERRQQPLAGELT